MFKIIDAIGDIIISLIGGLQKVLKSIFSLEFSHLAKTLEKDFDKIITDNSYSSSRVIINDQVWVNGKRLEKGTPEYDRAIKAGKEGMKAGMAGLDAGMKSLDNAMKNLDNTMKNMDDMFKKF